MQAGFARKYAIMEELDQGFGSGSTPEAFVRLDSWEGRIQANIHVKGLKQGPFQYRLYLIFGDSHGLKPILVGDVNGSFNGMQGGLEVGSHTLLENNIRPELVRYAALTAESKNRKWIPLFSSFEKGAKWDESIRSVLIMSTSPELEAKPEQEHKPERELKQILNDPIEEEEDYRAPGQAAFVANQVSQDNGIDNRADKSQGHMPGKTHTSNLAKLEGMLSNNFERDHPFKNANKDYIWYKVFDLSKLSNIMYVSGINVPLFANPKILVGLFKYKHILAGVYKGDKNENYYVIGVPGKDQSDNKPFENACRWAPIEESEVRDMTGYWLVYISLNTGQIVV
ncbi:MAG TPA: hypothetical protein VFD57_01640 [Clostridia bacterium]|nr:hypothetical protein [Clostridia bacterium]